MKIELKIELIIEEDKPVKLDDFEYHGYCKNIKGIHVLGDSPEETLKNLGEAIAAYSESLIKHNDKLEDCLPILYKVDWEYDSEHTLPSCSPYGSCDWRCGGSYVENELCHPKKPTGMRTERCGKKYKLEFDSTWPHLEYLRDKELVLSAEGDATREPYFQFTTASGFYIFSKGDNPSLEEDLIIASGIGEPIKNLILVE